MRITAICDVAEFWDNSQIYYRHNGGRGPAMDAIENHHRKAGLEARHHCAVYADFRVMLEKAGKDIDAVLVATPNHVHAVASMAAIHAGKGVYCEKPLTHSVYEARMVAQGRRARPKLPRSWGNQGHSSDDVRRAVEWIRDGAIGKVRQVHAWGGGPSRMKLTERPTETPPVPDGLNWDLWAGPPRKSGRIIPPILRCCFTTGGISAAGRSAIMAVIRSIPRSGHLSWNIPRWLKPVRRY